MIKRALTVAIAAAALLALAAPAQGQQYPPDTVFITVSDTTVVPGQPIDISAGLFVPGSPASFTFFSQPVNLGTATADADGVATLSVTIPSDATPGTHTITASGTGIDGEPLSVSTTVTVLADGAAGADDGATGGLPRTGSDPMPIARIAAALVAVGGGLLFITRRRRISSVA
jgi:LPXTG-motif cell wall-anchored protein